MCHLHVLISGQREKHKDKHKHKKKKANIPRAGLATSHPPYYYSPGSVLMSAHVMRGSGSDLLGVTVEVSVSVTAGMILRLIPRPMPDHPCQTTNSSDRSCRPCESAFSEYVSVEAKSLGDLTFSHIPASPSQRVRAASMGCK